MVNWALTVVSGVLSCFVAILSTVGVEKLGGKLGGALATTPTTIIMFAISLVLNGSDQAGLEAALFAVPPTMALTSFYLLVWRELPSLPFIAKYEKTKPILAITMVSLLAMSMWLTGATALYYLLPAAAENGLPVQATGLMGAVAGFAIGLSGLVFRNRPAPGGKLPVTWLAYASRGLLAGAAISISIILSTFSSTLSGIVSVFPAMATTAMISLWWSQELIVSQGSATSMACGTLAVSSFSMLFALMWPHVYVDDVSLGLALFTVSVLSWTFATFCVSIPMFGLVQMFKPAQQFAKLDTSESNELRNILVAYNSTQVEIIGTKTHQ